MAALSRAALAAIVLSGGFVGQKLA